MISKSPEQMLDGMQDIINKGVTAQIKFLNIFAMNLFKEVLNDINKIKKKTYNLSEKIRLIKESNTQYLNFFYEQDGTFFFDRRVEKPYYPRIEYTRQDFPGQSIQNIATMMEFPKQVLNFDNFAGIGRVKDPDEIMKRISDPSI